MQMDRKEMEKDSKLMEFMKIVEDQMHARFKHEQWEKARNFQILNRNVIKGQILFTGSSLMEQFAVAEIARNPGLFVINNPYTLVSVRHILINIFIYILAAVTVILAKKTLKYNIIILHAH